MSKSGNKYCTLEISESKYLRVREVQDCVFKVFVIENARVLLIQVPISGHYLVALDTNTL